MYNLQQQEFKQNLQNKIKQVTYRIEFIKSLNLDEAEHNEIITYLQECIRIFNLQLHKEAI